MYEEKNDITKRTWQENIELTDIYINSKAKRQIISDGFLKKTKFRFVIEKSFNPNHLDVQEIK
jgi:hypothetical protein